MTVIAADKPGSNTEMMEENIMRLPGNIKQMMKVFVSYLCC